jgi:hypothetical protein
VSTVGARWSQPEVLRALQVEALMTETLVARQVLFPDPLLATNSVSVAWSIASPSGPPGTLRVTGCGRQPDVSVALQAATSASRRERVRLSGPFELRPNTRHPGWRAPASQPHSTLSHGQRDCMD